LQASSTSSIGRFIDGDNRRRDIFLKRVQGLQPWILSGGEFDTGAPHLIQCIDGGTYHSRQILDWLEFTHRDRW
jgi:hypothetical protein